jgi:hypothetical protein
MDNLKSCTWATFENSPVLPTAQIIKSEDCLGLTQCTTTDWASYRFHQSTFEQLKQSVEKAKAALQDRNNFLGNSSAFR